MCSLAGGCGVLEASAAAAELRLNLSRCIRSTSRHGPLSPRPHAVAPPCRRDSMESVVAEMGAGTTLEEVMRVVEELSRIH